MKNKYPRYKGYKKKSPVTHGENIYSNSLLLSKEIYFEGTQWCDRS